MSERRWELVEDGYYKRSRYVQYPTGLIIGHVQGINCDSSKPWRACLDGTKGINPIGDYTTEGLAKRAVEAAQSSRRAK